MFLRGLISVLRGVFPLDEKGHDRKRYGVVHKLRHALGGRRGWRISDSLNAIFFWKFCNKGGRGVRKVVFYAWRNLQTTPILLSKWKISQQINKNSFKFIEFCCEYTFNLKVNRKNFILKLHIFLKPGTKQRIFFS